MDAQWGHRLNRKHVNTILQNEFDLITYVENSLVLGIRFIQINLLVSH